MQKGQSWLLAANSGPEDRGAWGDARGERLTDQPEAALCREFLRHITARIFG